MDALPPALLIELAGNASTVAQAASMGEVFRDMAAIAPHLAAADQTIVRPHLNPPRAPTVSEFLTACRHGDKGQLQKMFTTALTVFSQYQKSIDKLAFVLSSPLREELTTFVKTGAGMDIFQLDGMRDMVESQCFNFWNSWLRQHNNFVQRVMGNVGHRHFDIILLNKLAALESRNADNISSLFWTPTGSGTTESPFPGRGRSKDILTLVANRDFKGIYNKLMQTQNLSFPLLSKQQFSHFKQHNVAALRSVMDQVLRWLIP